MPGILGNNAAARESQLGARHDRLEEQYRQDRIRDGTQQIDTLFGNQFNEPFFDKRRQAYMDYASPQLEDQYGQAQKKLTFALDRSGTLDSSTRANRFGELQRLYDVNKQQIADQALAGSTEARNNVESSRADLIQMLNSTGDAQGAVNQSLSRSQALSAPQAFSPLGQIFATFTQGLGQQAAQERAEAASGGTYQAKFNTGLFAPPRRAVTVS